MTVAELIAELSNMPLDAKISVVGGINNENCQLFTDPIYVQEGYDSDTKAPFVEICSFSNIEEGD